MKFDKFTLGPDRHSRGRHLRARHGEPGQWLDVTVKAAVMALFFLHGARLSHAAVFAGVAHWRLHLAVLSARLAPVPAARRRCSVRSSRDAGFIAGAGHVVPVLPALHGAVVHRFHSIARGNVPAAVVSASLSNILGIVLTPILTGLLLARSGAISSRCLHVHRNIVVVAIRRRAPVASIDRGVGRPSSRHARDRRSRLHRADGLCGLQ